MSTPPRRDPEAAHDAVADDEAPTSGDDALLASVVAHARARRPIDALTPRLVALTEEELSPDAASALEAELAGLPEMDGVLAAFQPMDDAARARTTARILRDFRPAAAQPSTLTRMHAPPPVLAKRRLGRTSTILTSLAVAAGVLLGVNALRTTNEIPKYELTLAGEQPMRGQPAGDTELHTFSSHERFRLLLRPDRAVRGPVAARVFLIRGDESRRWETPVDISNEGAIRIVTPLDTLPPGSGGAWEMVVVVARPGALPDAPPPAGRKDDAAMHVLRARVEFEFP